jgi:hypothetical protein
MEKKRRRKLKMSSLDNKEFSDEEEILINDKKFVEIKIYKQVKYFPVPISKKSWNKLSDEAKEEIGKCEFVKSYMPVKVFNLYWRLFQILMPIIDTLHSNFDMFKELREIVKKQKNENVH